MAEPRSIGSTRRLRWALPRGFRDLPRSALVVGLILIADELREGPKHLELRNAEARGEI